MAQLSSKRGKAVLNPLSPASYYRRHKLRTALLIVLLAFVTLGLYVFVGLLDSVKDNADADKSYLTRFSWVFPISGPSLEPNDTSQIRGHPDVAQAIPAKSLDINVPSLIGTESFDVFGVPEADVQYLMNLSNVRLKEGHLPHARTSEIVLSEEIAKALDLHLGDSIGRSINKSAYGAIPTELVLVGILKSEPASAGQPAARIGLASFEYLDSHELYTQPAGLIVVAREGRQSIVDQFLVTTILSKHTNVKTYAQIAAFFGLVGQGLRLIFGIVDVLVAFITALVVGTINQIALSQRLEELGLLHAMGYTKNRLVRRVALETAGMVGMGWVGGLFLSWFVVLWLGHNLYEPRGMVLNLTDSTPIWFVLPIPLVVVALATWGISRVFANFDAVAVIERGKLSMEAKQRQPQVKRSSASPLSFWTFYLRHRRRSLMLVMMMALMTLGVAFPVFFLSPVTLARQFFIEYLRAVSVVSPSPGRTLDPGITAQIRTSPAVARVVPAMPLPLSVTIPPLSDAEINIWGVPENDLPYLLNLYGMRLEEGRLPHARTNEIVLSRAIMMNRNLRIGDAVGRPVYPLDGTPTEMIVVGILSPGNPWLGFASSEYLQSHELYATRAISFLVVPSTGRKAELDTWLEKNLASRQITVQTFDAQLHQIQQTTQAMFMLFAGVESIMALVAAIALAVLNGIFFAQRQEEFGILYAVGYSRSRLILRILTEILCLVIAAWLIGAAISATFMVYTQVSLYAPKGLSLDYFNLGQWLFTLPIPLTVVAASVLTMGWLLVRLDPISIIERR